MTNKLLSLITICLLISSCQEKKDAFDATGMFEADEIIVSAETTGKLLTFNVSEGSLLEKGATIATIDCEQIKLQKKQMNATYKAVGQKQNNATPQIQVLEEQLIPLQRQIETQQEQVKVLEKERLRMEKLVKADAVPAKQLDDIVGQLSILQIIS